MDPDDRHTPNINLNYSNFRSGKTGGKRRKGGKTRKAQLLSLVPPYPIPTAKYRAHTIPCNQSYHSSPRTKDLARETRTQTHRIRSLELYLLWCTHRPPRPPQEPGTDPRKPTGATRTFHGLKEETFPDPKEAVAAP